MDERVRFTDGIDLIHEALADPVRRQVLIELLDRETGVVELSDLVSSIEALDVVESDDSRHLEIRLYHVHLPKLAELGFVEFDARSKTVRNRISEETATLLSEAEAWGDRTGPLDRLSDPSGDE